MSEHDGVGGAGEDVIEPRKERASRARRRARSDSSWNPPGRNPLEGKDKIWVFVGVFTLVLALSAFISGVWMGKVLSDLRDIEAPVNTQVEGLEEVPFLPEGKQTALPAGSDAQTSPSEPAANPNGLLPSLVQPEGLENKSPVPEAKIAGSPAKEGKESPPPAAKKSPPPHLRAKYTLQVAAFNNPKEAQEMVDRLSSKGYAAYIITGKGAARGSLNRVRVGHFQSLQEARQFAMTFEKKEKMKTIITSLQ